GENVRDARTLGHGLDLGRKLLLLPRGVQIVVAALAVAVPPLLRVAPVEAQVAQPARQRHGAQRRAELRLVDDAPGNLVLDQQPRRLRAIRPASVPQLYRQGILAELADQ